MIDDLNWNPFSPHSWSRLLGLVHVPLFAAPSDDASQGEHAVLLDGRRASFEISVTKEESFDDNETLSWSWSANMRHAVILDEHRERMFVRRWDNPSRFVQFKIPTRQGAQVFLQQLQGAAPPRTLDVIEWVLRVFRHSRSLTLDAGASLTILNVLLLVMRQKSLGLVSERDVRAAQTLRELVQLLPMTMHELVAMDDQPNPNAAIGGFAAYMLDSRVEIGLEFRADLLFRHAASYLYQQAHLILERDIQTYLPGLAPEPRFTRGPKEVRYTPPNLARALVQQAFDRLEMEPSEESVRILDSACGSGVFLTESLHEWRDRGSMKPLQLLGRDISAEATQVAKACLQIACSEVSIGMKVEFEVRRENSLLEAWPAVDLVLMNPPFCSWPDMSDEDRESVGAVLGSLRVGRPDKALAFLWKAVAALRPGGVLAAVLPGALLDNQSGAAVREAIEGTAEILMLGRFEGFSYFESSTVETAFIIVRKRTSTQRPPITVLISAKGAEDASLRCLRGGELLPAESAQVELFTIGPSVLRNGSWMPRHAADIRLLEFLDSLGLPKTSELFHVQQGIRTGSKLAFLLSETEWRRLPKGERSYFRRAAGQGTIDKGRLIPGEYVFYPYDPKGLILENIEAARKVLPNYFERWLDPNREKLSQRRWADEWWLPERPRLWQFERRAKIVSTYFGKPGCFAFDAEGDYVVLEGFGWQWLPDESQDIDATTFTESAVPYAYLALLNSPLFERILACYSWRLKGGQLRLERRFLDDVPLPDLTHKDLSSQLFERLAELGLRISQGNLESVLPDLNETVFEAYRLPRGLVVELG
jgi:predicted RNA methylase